MIRGRDIAVVQLDRAIYYDGRFIAPICLPPKLNHVFNASSCTFIGSGHVNENNGNLYLKNLVLIYTNKIVKTGEIRSAMKELRMPIQDRNVCNRFLRNFVGPGDMPVGCICAGHKSDSSGGACFVSSMD